jgi:hypothetical protein
VYSKNHSFIAVPQKKFTHFNSLLFTTRHFHLQMFAFHSAQNRTRNETEKNIETERESGEIPFISFILFCAQHHHHAAS